VNGINQALAPATKNLLEARQDFESRVCDYKIAENNGDQSIMREFGPDGPRTDGGSYVYKLRQYKTALERLKSACQSDSGCAELMSTLKDNPSTKLPTRFHAHAEMKKACVLYRKRTPVPNDSKAGCSVLPGRENVCLYTSCRQWWETAHGSTSVVAKHGWKDSSPAYDALRKVCDYIDFAPENVGKGKNPSSLSMAEEWMQKEQKKWIAQHKSEFCAPRNVQGFCEDDIVVGGGKAEKCTLHSGNFCEAGRTLPSSMTDFGPAFGLND